MEKIMFGTGHVLGNNIDTDLIIPSTFLVINDERELGKYLFSSVYPDFASSVSQGDILIAGRNFGCGSSREHAPLAIRGAGFACIIAESFARTFYRNCINRGFPVIELENASSLFHDGDKIKVDIQKSTVFNITEEKVYNFIPFPDFVIDIWNYNGLFGYIQNRLLKGDENVIQ